MVGIGCFLEKGVFACNCTYCIHIELGSQLDPDRGAFRFDGFTTDRIGSVANPNPSPETRFQTGNKAAVGRRSRPDIEALDKLIAEMAAEPSIARTWLAAALGDVKKGIPPNPMLFKLLIEYRNGKVPDQVNLKYDDSDQEAKRIDVPDVDERSKGRKGRRAAHPKGKGGDVSS